MNRRYACTARSLCERYMSVLFFVVKRSVSATACANARA